MILLDTHVLLWLRDAPHHTGRNAFARLESALAAGEVWLSAISFWEIAMLARKRKIRVTVPLARWRMELASRKVIEIPMDGLTAAQAGALDWAHGDPADRILVATAMRLGLPLLTADHKILGWGGSVDLIDARV